MIAITLQGVRAAESVFENGYAWVTLRFDGGHRTVALGFEIAHGLKPETRTSACFSEAAE